MSRFRAQRKILNTMQHIGQVPVPENLASRVLDISRYDLIACAAARGFAYLNRVIASRLKVSALPYTCIFACDLSPTMALSMIGHFEASATLLACPEAFFVARIRSRGKGLFSQCLATDIRIEILLQGFSPSRAGTCTIAASHRKPLAYHACTRAIHASPCIVETIFSCYLCSLKLSANHSQIFNTPPQTSS